MSFIGEFKEFIAKGNVMDMAVGVVVGGAFTSIVNSLVKDVITPAIALITKLFQSKAGNVAGAVGAEEQAAKMLEFEYAAELRDKIEALKQMMGIQT